MGTKARFSADLWCGLLLLAISVLSLWVNSQLEFGRTRDIGPGYFPVLISCALGALSFVMILRGIIAPSDSIGAIDGRPVFFILISFVAFAALINTAGLLIAILAQVVCAHFACRDARPIETALMGLGLPAVSALIFVVLLKMPVGLLP